MNGGKINKLLIVDDSPSMRMLIRAEVEDMVNIEIIEACNGNEGIEKAKVELPDIITMDMEMPEVDGLEAISKIRSHPECANIPIIVITSNTDIHSSKRAYQSGAIEFILKPFNPGSLRQYIESTLNPGKEFEGINILVVDEAKAIRTIITRILEKRGAKVYAMMDGIEAIECLKKEQIDLVITDYIMPRMNGIELCRYIRLSMGKLELPIIVITSAGEYSVAIEAMNAGADDYLTKPFSREELQVRIKNHIRLIRYHQSTDSIQNQLIQSAKLASLGEMSAGVAHEINNPLGVIKLSLGELKDIVEVKEYEEIPDVLERMNRNVDRCTKIVAHLKTFSRDAQRQEKKMMNINVIIGNALQFFEQQFAIIDITLEKDLLEEIPSVLCNSLQIEQIIINLMSNARDAVEGIKEDAKIIIRSYRSAKRVFIDVNDNGIGISKKECDLIFDPFYTTKEVGKGTGLGLSISQTIIEEHNGSLKVESIEGQGSIFTISFQIPAKY